MGIKATGSKPVTAIKPPLWNRVVDSMLATERQRLGSGISNLPNAVSTDVIKIKNNTGGNLSRGSVVQLSSHLLTALDDYDPDHLWLSGIALENPADKPVGILRRPIPDGDIDECQVSGVCIARVNVVNKSHAFAFPKYGQSYLESGNSGPFSILNKFTTSTGQQECIVSMFVGLGIWRGVTIDAITHSTEGTVKLVRKVGGVYVSYQDVDSADLTVEVGGFTLNTAESIEEDTAIFMTFMPDGTWEALSGNCAVRDWELDDEGE